MICPLCGSERIRPRVYGYPGPELVEEAESGEVVLGGCMVTGADPELGCLDCGAGLWPDGRFQPVGAPHGSHQRHILTRSADTVTTTIVAYADIQRRFHIEITERGELVRDMYGIDAHRLILAVDPHDVTLLAGALIGAVFKDSGPFERWLFSLTKHLPAPATTGQPHNVEVPVEELPHLLLQLTRAAFDKGVFMDAFDLARLLNGHGIPFTFAEMDSSESDGGRGGHDRH